MHIQLAIEKCLVEGINFAEVQAIVDWRDENRADWDHVLEDGPYPNLADFPLTSFGYSSQPNKPNLKERVIRALPQVY